jgi:hypothetical protein
VRHETVEMNKVKGNADCECSGLYHIIRCTDLMQDTRMCVLCLPAGIHVTRIFPVAILLPLFNDASVKCIHFIRPDLAYFPHFEKK